MNLKTPQNTFHNRYDFQSDLFMGCFPKESPHDRISNKCGECQDETSTKINQPTVAIQVWCDFTLDTI